MTCYIYFIVSPYPNSKDLVNWWTLMQQHGAPSRLLDWCTSAFVALYFAVIDSPNEVGTVWAVNHSLVTSAIAQQSDDSVPQLSFNRRNDGKSCLTFLTRRIQTQRMIAQQSVFSICDSILDDHGEVLEKLLKDEKPGPGIVRMNIPANLKSEFLVRLRGMNISASSLFPGLDGLGRSIRESAETLAATLGDGIPASWD